MDLRLIPAHFALLTFILPPAQGALPPIPEVFPFAHEAKINPGEIQEGKVVGNRVPSDGRGLSMSVESFYLLPSPPSEVIKLMLDSTSATDAEASDTLAIDGHYPISTPPQATDFNPFTLSDEKSSRFGFGGSKMLDADVSRLNLSQEEAQQLTRAAREESRSAVEAAWQSILLLRAKNYYEGGLVQSDPYSTGRGEFQIRQELVALLKSRPDVLERFQDILGVTMTGKPLDGMLPPNFYWQNQKIQGQRTVTMAGIVARPFQSGYQVVDCTFYVTGGYFTSIIIYEIHPVTVDGREQCLVWRGDFVISPSINFLKGVERMAAENIMLLEIKKSVESFIDEVRRKG